MPQQHPTFHVIFLKNVIWWPEKKNIISFFFSFPFLYFILFLKNGKNGKITSSQPPTNLPPIKMRGTVVPPVTFPMCAWMACIQIHYIQVARWALLTEQNMRFRLVLGQWAVLKILLLRELLNVFMGKKLQYGREF